MGRLYFVMNAVTKIQQSVENYSPRWVVIVFCMGVIAWVPAQLIGIFVSSVAPGPEPAFRPDATVADAIILGLIVAPVLETQLMRLCLAVLTKNNCTRNVACLITGAIFVLLHNPSRSWGLHAWWSFWVMGNCYVACERRSVSYAILVTTAVHSLFNFLSYATALLSRYTF